MSKIKTIAIALLVACTSTPSPQPPPIAAGKCVADIYSADLALTQSCNWAGYSWRCEWSHTTETNTCKRVGEAVGERAK